MALTPQEKEEALNALLKDLTVLGVPTSITKPDYRILIDSYDQALTDLSTQINNYIPLPLRNQLSDDEKTLAMARINELRQQAF